MKMAVFWVAAPCSLAEVYRRFRGVCCLHPETHLEGCGASGKAVYEEPLLKISRCTRNKKINKERKKKKAGNL
jgi:hypothetical protein